MLLNLKIKIQTATCPKCTQQKENSFFKVNKETKIIWCFYAMTPEGPSKQFIWPKVTVFGTVCLCQEMRYLGRVRSLGSWGSHSMEGSVIYGRIDPTLAIILLQFRQLCADTCLSRDRCKKASGKNCQV